MIREKASVEDFKKIAKDNEYFLWNFLMEDQYNTINSIWSIFDKKINPYTEEIERNPLDVLLSMTDIPYYESYVKDSVDFLINLGLNAKNIYMLRNPWPNRAPERRWYYVPVLIGFKRTRMVYNTHKYETCYCVEGAAEIIMNLNPELLSNIE
jgi:hypothetical protein